MHASTRRSQEPWPSADLAGRVAIVTGAAGGIGSEVSRALLGAGARLAVLDTDARGLKRLADDAPPGQLITLPGDVRNPVLVEAAVEEAERRLGPVDLLASVAGVLRTGRVVEMDDEAWHTVLDVNVGGAFTVSRAVARRMIPRRRGAIVTVASNAGRVPRMGMSVYAASKAATAMFTKCLGLELAEYGIRCNVVAPGSTLTDMQRAMWTDGLGPEQVLAGSPADFRSGIPLGRMADPRDVADAVVFLLSDRSRQITMHELVVDGGAALGA